MKTISISSIFCAVLLAFAPFSLSAVLPAHANEDITGAISGSAQPATMAASAQFGQALDLIAAEEYAQAYQLARGFGNDVERRAVQWAAIYFGRGAIDHQSVLRFSQDAADLATENLFRTRMEQAVVDEDLSHQQVISLLGGQMPSQLDAALLLAEAYASTGQMARGVGIAQQLWTDNFLSTEQESRIMGVFAPQFDNAAHWARAVHLMMHDRINGAQRLSGFLTPAQNSLVAARAAVARRQSDAQTKLNAVDPSLRDHPVFLFSQGQLARRQGQLVAAIDYFNAAGTANLPDSAEWWYERRYLGRQLLARGDARNAYRAVSFFQEGPEGRVVDANLHAGWLALHYLDDPNAAVTHFEKMRSLSTLESSITKSNYWLGRAYLAAGNEGAAQIAFQRAAAYPTSYYGVLSLYRLGQKQIDIRPLPNAAGREALFNQRQIVRVIQLMANAGHPKIAEPLVTRLIYTSSDPADMVLTARLAQQIGAHNLAILMADVAEQRGQALDLFNYPRDGLPQVNLSGDVDLAAVYAVARQESKFDFDVISSAGARGLMQLMPATAEETAQHLGVSYSSSRLTSDPEYNAMLGAHYLSRQLARYDNSLILAAAAYNAGGGNVNKWISTYGNPSASNVDPVLWIELIPFAETRNYVQRVIANYVIYRARLGLPPVDIAQALRKI